MAYGTYYRRDPTMGDMVNPRRRLMDPNDPQFAGGVNQTQPVGDPTGVPPSADPSTLDRWGRAPGHPDFGMRPRYEDRPDRSGERGRPGYSPDGRPTPPDSRPPPTPPGAPPTTPPTNRRAHAYTGSALAYYGTGNIDGAEDLQGGSHASTGVNTKGWGTNERGTNSIKNTAMKIATRYPPKPSSIDLWLTDPDTKRFFPNARKVGFDKIDFGDGKPVDVLKAADPETDSAEAWAFMPESESVPVGAGAGMAAARVAGAPADPSTLDSWGRAPGHPDFGNPPTTSGSGPPRQPRYVGPSFRDWVDGDWRSGRGEP